MELEARIATVRMAETFVISRGASDEAEVVDVELRHEGVSGFGEAAPIERYDESPASALAFLQEELMRDLQEDASAVAGLRIGADGAAMLEVAQDAQAIGDDLVALDIVYVGDEADAAGIMLMTRIIEAVRLRQAFGKEMGRACHGLKPLIVIQINSINR